MGSRMFMLAMLESNLLLDCLYICCEQVVFYSNLLVLVIYAHMHLCSWCVGEQRLHWPLFALFSSTLLWTIPHLFHIFCLSIYLETLFKIPKMNNHVAYFMPIAYTIACNSNKLVIFHIIHLKKNLNALFNNRRLVAILDTLYLEILMGPNFTWGY
jgi:hypothetical protein